MSTITQLMSHHHRECDADFAELENLVAANDWVGAAVELEAFANHLQTHFSFEEETLFPRFESVTGMRMGPTQVMRDEHKQMRAVLARMQLALKSQDEDEFSGEAETLLILMQQHNMKEENILYPMCDDCLADEIDALTSHLKLVLHGVTS